MQPKLERKLWVFLGSTASVKETYFNGHVSIESSFQTYLLQLRTERAGPLMTKAAEIGPQETHSIWQQVDPIGLTSSYRRLGPIETQSYAFYFSSRVK